MYRMICVTLLAWSPEPDFNLTESYISIACCCGSTSKISCALYLFIQGKYHASCTYIYIYYICLINIYIYRVHVAGHMKTLTALTLWTQVSTALLPQLASVLRLFFGRQKASVGFLPYHSAGKVQTRWVLRPSREDLRKPESVTARITMHVRGKATGRRCTTGMTKSREGQIEDLHNGKRRRCVIDDRLSQELSIHSLTAY